MTDNCGIPETLSQEVFSAQLELRGAFRDSLRVGVRLGHLLTEAKTVCRHGEFGRWLTEHFEGSTRQGQRFMELARAYPDPKDIPALSLREALRLIAGKRGKRNEKHFAHERLSRGAVGELLKTLMAFAQTFQEEIITVWEVERVTPHHAAMKKARKIETAIRRFAEHLQEDFRAHQAEGETSDDELAASVESLAPPRPASRTKNPGLSAATDPG